jgi:hypothetical protein
MLYADVSSLKTKLWITNTNSNSELSLIIKEATDLIDSEIWFNLEKRTVNERINWNWNNKLYLKNKAISILQINDKNNISYDLDVIDWYILYLENNVPKWIKNITVSYEVGFTAIPADIKSICLDLCVILSNHAWIIWTNTEKLIDKNIKTQKLWSLSITYFGENEKRLNPFEKLSPSKNIDKILNKYKSFSWII